MAKPSALEPLTSGRWVVASQGCNYTSLRYITTDTNDVVDSHYAFLLRPIAVAQNGVKKVAARPLPSLSPDRRCRPTLKLCVCRLSRVCTFHKDFPMAAIGKLKIRGLESSR